MNVSTRVSPVATGGFGGLSPPKKSSKTPKLKRETLQRSGFLVNFKMASPPAELQSTPIENFLATVLARVGYVYN